MYTLDDKKSWLKSYENNRFNITRACEETDINRETIRVWKNSGGKELYFDGDNKEYTFAEAMHECRDKTLDKIEGILLSKAIDQEDSHMVMFLAKTLMKHRGYSEKIELDNKVEIKSNNSDFYKAVMEHIKKKKGE